MHCKDVRCFQTASGGPGHFSRHLPGLARQENAARRLSLLDRVAEESSRKGRGAVNKEEGLDFYDRLVDTIARSGGSSRSRRFSTGICPQALEDEGGFESALDRRGRPTSTRKRSSAGSVTELHHWATHNEPWVYAWIGHSWGPSHAPGLTSEAEAVADVAPPAARATAGRSRRSGEIAPEAQVGIVSEPPSPPSPQVGSTPRTKRHA